MNKRNIILMSVIMLFMVSVLQAQDYTWHQITLPDSYALRCSAISHLNQIYISNEDSLMLLRSDDLGEHWIECPILQYNPAIEDPMEIYQVQVAPSGTVYAEISPRDRWAGDGNRCGIYYSIDEGVQWEMRAQNDWCDPWPMSMAPNGDIFCGGFDGFVVYYYPDGGEYLGPHHDFGSSFPCANSNHEMITNDPFSGMLMAYLDGSWKKFRDIESEDEYGGQYGYTYPYHINSLSHLFYTSHYTDLFRSTNKGDSWEKIFSSPVELNVLEIDGNDHIYLSTDNGVLKSRNNGDSWDLIGLSGKMVGSLDYNNSGNLVVSVYSSEGRQIFFGHNNFQRGLLTVESPASEGMELPMLEEFRIEWNSAGNVGTEVKLELYENRKFKNIIVDKTPNDGAFSWLVTRYADEIAEYQFKVTDRTDISTTAWSPSFRIIREPDLREPKNYTAGRISEFYIPDMDGSLSDTVWEYADTETLTFGGEPGTFNTPWDQWDDACIRWKSVWCEETNRLYLAVDITDDVRGNFDNGEGDIVYLPAGDESIEIMTDGNSNGGNFWGMFDEAQYWRMTEENEWNLLNYPVPGDQLYQGDHIVSSVTQGINGNWTCEISMPLFDVYPVIEKKLQTWDSIGWEIWYNDSDNGTDNGNYFGMDHQLGWMYSGESWKICDFSGNLVLGGYIETLIPSKTVVIKTVPINATFIVDHSNNWKNYEGEQTFYWPLNSTHIVGTWGKEIADATRYGFISWSDGGAQEHEYTVTDESDTLIAYYGIEYYLYIWPHYLGVTGEGWYRAGTTAVFSAMEEVVSGNTRFVFEGWSGTFSDTVLTGEILMDRPRGLDVLWDTEYLLRVLVQNNEGGTVYPADSIWVDINTDIQITACPDIAGGYEFSGWTGDYVGDQNPVNIHMGDPKTVIAVFTKGTGVESTELPGAYALHRNVPNPFNPETGISYDIPESGHVRIEVFDLMGRKVRTLMNGESSAGSYRVLWNGLDDSDQSVGSGTYIIVMRSGDYEKKMKAVFLK